MSARPTAVIGEEWSGPGRGKPRARELGHGGFHQAGMNLWDESEKARHVAKWFADGRAIDEATGIPWDEA